MVLRKNAAMAEPTGFKVRSANCRTASLKLADSVNGFGIGLSGPGRSNSSPHRRLNSSRLTTPASWRHQSQEASQETEVTLELAFHFVGRWLKAQPSLASLLEVCQLAPLNLYLNEERICGQYWPKGYTSDICGCLQVQGSFDTPALKSFGGMEKKVTIEGAPFSASIFVCRPEDASLSGLTVVLNGVAYRGEGEPLDNPCLCGALVTDVLKANLSRTGVVQDKMFARITEMLRIHSEDFLVELVEGPLAFSKATLAVAPGIRHLRQRFEERGDKRKETLDYWLAATEEQAQASEQDLQVLKQQAEELEAAGSRAEAEVLRVRLLEQQLGLLVKYSFNQERLLRLGRELIWTTEFLEPKNFRIRQVQELAVLCQALEGSREGFQWLTADSRAALCRFQNDVKRAFIFHRQALEEDGRKSSRRGLAELELRRGDRSNAQTLLLKNLGLETVEALGEPTWLEEQQDLDLMADVLELEGRLELSLHYREVVCQLYSTPYLSYLRYLEVARRARGLRSFSEWVRYRARASFLGARATLTGWKRPIPTLLKKLWAGSWQPTDEELHREFDTFFLDNHIWKEFVSFVAGRLAHKLRMDGFDDRADVLVTRTRVLQRVVELQDLLRRGQES